jgi:hypothetical protein
MGALRDFDLSRCGCNVYVETGTGMCNTLSKAIPIFDRCFSVDIDSEQYLRAKKIYPQANLYRGLSSTALEYWFTSGDLRADDRILFFLDAHFAAADYRTDLYDVHAPYAVPLKEELEIIKKYRPNGGYYVICDDLRIYADGPFEYGDRADVKVPGGLAFLYNLYPKHRITLDYREHGYIWIDGQDLVAD